jgi:hypothetical protein
MSERPRVVFAEPKYLSLLRLVAVAVIGAAIGIGIRILTK